MNVEDGQRVLSLRRQSARAVDRRHDSVNAFFLSIASAWEIAIKHGNGRLALPDEPLVFVRSRAHADGIGLLAIQLEHVCAAAQLPRHHGDPFDRLLIAQARAEQLTAEHEARAGSRLWRCAGETAKFHRP